MGKNKHSASVESPWPNEPLILRGDTSRSGFKRQLRAAIDSGAPYIVREVEVGYLPDVRNPKQRHSHDELVDIVSNTIVHFGILKGYGIHPADTEYRIVQDEENVLRTLARVAVVDGRKLNRQASHGLGKAALERLAPLEVRDALADRVEAYIKDHRNHIRLGDVGTAEQFMYGDERAVPPDMRQPEIRLIDPDALLRRPLSAA